MILTCSRMHADDRPLPQPQCSPKPNVGGVMTCISLPGREQGVRARAVRYTARDMVQSRGGMTQTFPRYESIVLPHHSADPVRDNAMPGFWRETAGAAGAVGALSDHWSS